MTSHYVTLGSVHYRAIASGQKLYHFDHQQRDFEVGDKVTLAEVVTSSDAPSRRTGHYLEARVSWVDEVRALDRRMFSIVGLRGVVHCYEGRP